MVLLEGSNLVDMLLLTLCHLSFQLLNVSLQLRNFLEEAGLIFLLKQGVFFELVRELNQFSL